MLHYFPFLLILVGVLVTIGSWRRGIFAMILLAAIQDPIRKLTPGTPSYLVLASTPVFFAMTFVAFERRVPLWSLFKKSHGKLASSVKLFLISLVPGVILSLSYGVSGVLLVLMGLLTYLTLIFGWLLGNAYRRKFSEMRKVLAFYCVVTSVMLTGSALQYLHFFGDWAAIGTNALDTVWVRYTANGVIHMIAGFYRSPDIMGWHAVVAAMLAAILAASERGGRRLFWIILAAWAAGMAMLCGRRKMVLMLPVFALVFTWLYWQAHRRTRMVAIIGVLMGVLLAGYIVYDYMGSNTIAESYYFETMRAVPGRLNKGSYAGVMETYRQSGFFGEGIGTAATGAHNLSVKRPRTWQEGGLDYLMVELGVPGLLCFLFMSYMLVRRILVIVLKRLDRKSEDFPIMAGLTGIFFANTGSFIVSHQIFGDPFILTFFSFLTGLLLSAGRVELPVRVGRSVTASGLPRRVSPLPVRHSGPYTAFRDRK